MSLAHDHHGAQFRLGVPSARRRLVGWGFLTLLVLLGGFFSCEDAASTRTLVFDGPTMGTHYTVKVRGLPPGLEREDLAQAITHTLEQVDRRMSTYREDSELSRFNQTSSTDWVMVSKPLAAVVAEALHISKMSDGAFDVTVGPLVNLWGFGPDQALDAPPTAEAIHAVRTRVDYTAIHSRSAPAALRKENAAMYVDLSAIAKGYGVDQVAQLLVARGIDDYMVEIGGEVRAKGESARQRPWRIGIEKPAPDRRVVQEIIELRDAAVATSGDYRNFFEHGGRRFSHTINPRTGRPVTHGLASVTVVDGSAMRADGISTTLMVLGPESGYELALRENLAALFLVKKETAFVAKTTPAFEQYRVRP